MGKKVKSNIVEKLLNQYGNGTDGIGGISFTSTNNIQKRAQIQATEAVGNLFREGLSDGENPVVNWFWNYRIYPGANLPTRYWFEINDFITWYMVPLHFYSEDAEQDKELDLMKRNALLFDNVVMVKDGNLWRAKMYIREENGGVWAGELYSSWNQFKQNSQGEVVSKQKGEVFYSEYVKIDLFYDKIGIYVKAIPYLGLWLYYRSLKEKSVSYMNVVPDTSHSGKQWLDWLCKPEVTELKNFSIDNQDSLDKQQADETHFKSIQWYTPEAQVEIVYRILNFEIDKIYELLSQKFGKPTKAVDAQQTLSSEANVYAEQAKAIFANIEKNFIRALKKMGINKKEEVKEEETNNSLKKENGAGTLQSYDEQTSRYTSNKVGDVDGDGVIAEDDKALAEGDATKYREEHNEDAGEANSDDNPDNNQEIVTQEEAEEKVEEVKEEKNDIIKEEDGNKNTEETNEGVEATTNGEESGGEAEETSGTTGDVGEGNGEGNLENEEKQGEVLQEEQETSKKDQESNTSTGITFGVEPLVEAATEEVFVESQGDDNDNAAGGSDSKDEGTTKEGGNVK